ncbi:MAG TPA: hypothetical protein VLC91_07055 [Spongiibacteraceae bacterium]|nr:hypothetical protein [Spongiibacteraceae bacterium]
MRRIAVVAMLVSVLAGAVGAEGVIKAVQNSNLPKGSVTVEEIQTVVAEAEVLSSADNEALRNAAKPSVKSTQDLAYAMH